MLDLWEGAKKHQNSCSLKGEVVLRLDKDCHGPEGHASLIQVSRSARACASDFDTI